MEKSGNKVTGHVVAMLTVIVWGATFVASKLLLEEYSSLQLMLMRFVLGYVTLFLLRPRLQRPALREELRFFLISLFGCTLYFLFENGALHRSYASNVSILVATAPIFTALLAALLLRQRPGRRLWLGFALALFGVALVVFNGAVRLQLSPLGDFFSLCAACSWGFYATLQQPLLQRFDGITIARKVALYGLLTTLPVLLCTGERLPSPAPLLASPRLLLALLFLGVLGSGITYFAWAFASRRLGVIVTNNYIFAMPFITLVVSALLLRESVSWMAVLGSVFILLGVALADRA